MTSAQAASFAILIGALTLIFLLMIVGIPRVARLLFRSRLESIRDECMDAILDDRIREVSSVRRFLRLVEAAAAIPHLLTLPRLFALTRALVDSGVDTRSAGDALWSFEDLALDERRIMKELDSRLCAAYMSYLNWGSPGCLVRGPAFWLLRLARPASEILKVKEAMPTVARETLRDPDFKPSTFADLYGQSLALGRVHR